METVASHIRRLVAPETDKSIEAVRFNSTLGQLTNDAGDLARLTMEVERVYDIQITDLKFSTTVAELTAEVLQTKQMEAA